MNKRLFILCWLFACGLSAAAQGQRAFRLFYADSGKIRLMATLPAYPTGRAVLYCPGTARPEETENVCNERADFFARLGVACFQLFYRRPDATAEAFVDDAQQAMRLIRDSAQAWHLNPDDIGMMGDGAGGFVVARLCTESRWAERPDFAILLSPILSMDARDRARRAALNPFCDRGFDPATPLNNRLPFTLRPHLTPPALLLATTDSPLLSPVNNALAYYAAMQKVGNRCALHVYGQGSVRLWPANDNPLSGEMQQTLSSWLASLPSPQPGAVRVACIGNSITEGMGIPLSSVYGYPARLQQLLGPRFYVRNFGVSSRTMLNLGDRPYMRELAWRDARDFRPDVVIVKLGTNDSKEENWRYGTHFEADLQAMVDTLKSLPSHPRIVLATPIPAFKPTWTINDSVLVHAITPAVRRVAKRRGCLFLDLHRLSGLTEGDMQVDGIHPTAAGADKIAQVVASFIVDNW